jgi:small subunit ribosomal protein S17
MQKNRKKRVGHVISNKMNQTAIVVVETRRPHRLYKRIVKQISKFMAHDEKNECQIGDTVQIMEHRPISKEKRWIVTEIISRKEVVEVLETDIEIPKAKPEQVEVKAKAEIEVTEPEAEAVAEIATSEETPPDAKTKTVAEAKADTNAEAEAEAEDQS